MKAAETELGAVEFLFLVNVFGAFTTLGLGLSGFLVRVRDAQVYVPAYEFCVATAGLIFALGLIVTSVLLYQDGDWDYHESDVPVHAGRWTVLGGWGITRLPLIKAGMIWSVGGFVVLSIAICALFP